MLVKLRIWKIFMSYNQKYFVGSYWLIQFFLALKNFIRSYHCKPMEMHRPVKVTTLLKWEHLTKATIFKSQKIVTQKRDFIKWPTVYSAHFSRYGWGSPGCTLLHSGWVALATGTWTGFGSMILHRACLIKVFENN